MANVIVDRCRLCLVTAAEGDPATRARRLAAALSGGDVASIIIIADPNDPTALQLNAEALVPIAQARGVAALVHNETRIAGRTGADGVHVDSGPFDLMAATSALRPKKIVGAGGLRSRHDAMVAAEAEPDYLFFGRLDGDAGEHIVDTALDVAAWWSSVAVIPAVVMGGRSLASVTEAARAGIDFVALSRAVWQDRRGPAEAVAEACDRLTAMAEPAA